MTSAAQIASKVARGYGIGATKLGRTTAIYRPSGALTIATGVGGTTSASAAITIATGTPTASLYNIRVIQ